jgi:hypothetical protein
VVTRDVEDHAIVVGAPARMVGYMCECGARLPPSLTCACGCVYAKHGGKLCAVNVGNVRAKEPFSRIRHRPMLRLEHTRSYRTRT